MGQQGVVGPIIPKNDTRYNPTVWANGDKVTTDRLNKIELELEKMYTTQEPLIVNFTTKETDLSYIADKKYIDVYNAFTGGRTVLFDYTDILSNGTMMAVVVGIGLPEYPSVSAMEPFNNGSFYVDSNMNILWSYNSVA